MWILYAVSASILWGLSYAIDGQIFKRISVATTLSFACLLTSIILFLISFLRGTLKNDIAVISSSKKISFLLISGTIAFVLAELLIGLSINSKSATMAGLIEISYPVFIAIFSYILFKENQINYSAIIGGLVIFTGIFIIFFNR